MENQAVEYDNKSKVTIVLDKDLEKRHNMYYTNSTIKFNDNPIRFLSTA